MSKTGRIEIKFSRDIKINFDKATNSQDMGTRRHLVSGDETYTEQEKKQLAEMIIIDYSSQFEAEDADAPSLTQVEVVEATPAFIEL